MSLSKTNFVYVSVNNFTKLKRNRYTPQRIGRYMIQYSCASCGMAVVGMKCAKCGNDLVHDTITTADGRVVAVARCPEGCGKIKSPMCCGTDMACDL